jgi:hypothetical protein
MTDDERRMFAQIVHALRMKGWSRLDAEGEALNRIERRRASMETGTHHGK